MKILNKWKTIISILLVITLFFYIISINSKHKRYIDEDKEQFSSNINTLMNKSKLKMDNIISNNEEIDIEDKDIEILMIYHNDLKRSIFGFKKKAKLINEEVRDGIQEIWDKYNYEEDINLEDTIIYYENLLESVKNKGNLKLKDEDIRMLEGIYNLYNEINKEMNKIL